MLYAHFDSFALWIPWVDDNLDDMRFNDATFLSLAFYRIKANCEARERKKKLVKRESSLTRIMCAIQLMGLPVEHGN